MTLRDVRSRAEKATKGPWVASGDSWGGDDYWTVVAPDGAVVAMEPTEFSAYESGAFISTNGLEANRDFIAHARSDVPMLLDALDRANAALARVRSYLVALGHPDGKHPCPFDYPCPWRDVHNEIEAIDAAIKETAT